MLRKNNKKLNIGWISPTVGTFGAVREMVEVSNVLYERGHRVTIYHPDGTPVKWLASFADCRRLEEVDRAFVDVLIGIVDWKPELYSHLVAAHAKVKAICLLGFEPTEQMAKALQTGKNLQDAAQRMIYDATKKKFLVLTDSSWQIEWMRTHVGYPAGPSFGGINLSMFYPLTEEIPENPFRIAYSGDPRERKGTEIVEKAIALVKAERPNVEVSSYWGRKFLQPELVSFLQHHHVFLDAHRRAGWCNPVAEAIACGNVPVCTDIGANRDFAQHDETALRVPVDDYEAMAKATISLIDNPARRKILKNKGLKLIQQFSYNTVVSHLENFLESKVHDKT